jgi:hypothetical protein
MEFNGVNYSEAEMVETIVLGRKSGRFGTFAIDGDEMVATLINGNSFSVSSGPNGWIVWNNQTGAGATARSLIDAVSDAIRKG